MDLIFLLDGSGSVGREGFAKMKQFMKSVVVGIDLVINKVGVIQYSHWYATRYSE